MFRWTKTFLILLAAVVITGFRGLTEGPSSFGEVFFTIFVASFLIAIFSGRPSNNT